jgi:hypothetical protein
MKILEKGTIYNGDYVSIGVDEEGKLYAEFTLYDEVIEGDIYEVLSAIGEWLERAGYDYDKHQDKIRELRTKIEYLEEV